ncbi:hypothetical protein P7C70_g2762, partial [Phenoliferia sp. Uapishka_3]
MGRPVDLPAEVLSLLIHAGLEDDSDNQTLLSSSLVCKAWRQEAQNILFIERSRLRNQENIKSWCIAAGRYAIKRVVVEHFDSMDFGFEPGTFTRPTAEDFMKLLDALGSSLSSLEIQISLLSEGVLLHPALQELKSLRLELIVEDTCPSLPIASPLPFSLNSLHLHFQPEPEGDQDDDYTHFQTHCLILLLETLQPSLSHATELKIYIELEYEGTTPYPEGLSEGVGNLIRATSATLERLDLQCVDYHPYINESLSSLTSLIKIVDRPRWEDDFRGGGNEQDIQLRLLALPPSLKVFYQDVMEPDEEYEALIIQKKVFFEMMLEDDGFLPMLEEVALTTDFEGKWTEKEEEEIKELIRRRSGIRFVEISEVWC